MGWVVCTSAHSILFGPPQANAWRARQSSDGRPSRQCYYSNGEVNEEFYRTDEKWAPD
jgi:hypothetical protein